MRRKKYQTKELYVHVITKSDLGGFIDCHFAEGDKITIAGVYKIPWKMFKGKAV